MRNLKRALSLALSTVMLVGMMAVGTSAASYADVDSADNVEAIEVMQAVSVMVGDENGNFNPDKNVTRAEMAVVMANLLDLQVEDFVGASIPFTDVPEWAHAYVAACYADGITGGISATEYGSNNSVTATQAALMMMKALGYFQYAQDFGTDWQVATIKQASKIELFDGIDSARNAAMTRNEVAQIALNALEATMVESDGTTTTITTGDITINTGDTKYKDRDAIGDYDYDKTTATGNATLQLCENLYGEDLEKNGKTDDFGRPGNTWEYKGDPVAFSADEAELVIAGEDFDFADDLEDYTVVGTGENATKFIYNGSSLKDFNKDYTDKFDGTKGVEVEVYVDDDDNITHVIVTEYYVAQIDSIDLNDDDEVESVDMVVYEAGQSISSSNKGTDKYGVTITVNVKADEDAYALIEDYEEDDVFMVCLMGDWETEDADIDKKLLAVDDVETINGEVTAMNTSTAGGYTSYNSSWIRVDGERYYFASEYTRAEVEKGSDGAFYLYNGYIVHFDGSVGEAEDNYLFVVRGGSEADRWENITAYAEVVFADGTTEVVDLDTDSDGLAEKGSGGEVTGYTVTSGIYSYKYDEDNDEYTLTTADDSAGTMDFTKGSTKIGGTARANSSTVFVYITLTDDGAVDGADVYTGYRNAPSKKVEGSASATNGAYIVYTEAGSTTAEYVFVVGGDSTSGNDDVIFIAGASVSGVIDDKDVDKTYYLYNAVVDGQIVEIMVDSTIDGAGSKTGVFNDTATDGDGVYTTVGWNAPDADEFGSANNGNFGRAEDDVITISDAEGSETLAYSDDVQVFVASADGDITEGSINRNYSKVNIRYFMNEDGEVNLVFIQRLS